MHFCNNFLAARSVSLSLRPPSLCENWGIVRCKAQMMSIPLKAGTSLYCRQPR